MKLTIKTKLKILLTVLTLSLCSLSAHAGANDAAFNAELKGRLLDLWIQTAEKPLHCTQYEDGMHPIPKPAQYRITLEEPPALAAQKAYLVNLLGNRNAQIVVPFIEKSRDGARLQKIKVADAAFKYSLNSGSDGLEVLVGNGRTYKITASVYGNNRLNIDCDVN